LKSIFKRFGPQVLRSLDAKASTNLLCLLGAESDDECTHQLHNRPRRSNRGLNRLNWWEEVIQIAVAKENMEHVLGEKEIFWTMRAYLERSRLPGLPGACFMSNYLNFLVEPTNLATRDMAKAYYSRLSARMRSERDVIVPYLRIFLNCPSTSGFENALSILCDYLVKWNEPHRDVVDTLWRVILVNGKVLSLDNKSTILDAMLHRLDHLNSGIFSGRDPPLSIEDIVSSFAAAFFPCHQKSDLCASFSWIKDCVRASIAEDLPTDDRFSNLILIAMWLLPQEHSGSLNLQVASNSLKSRTIIGLAILERSLRSRSAAFSERREMDSIARSLWDMWKDAATFDIPKDVSRVVALTFLHTAFWLEDDVLLDACITYISSDTLWAVSPGNKLEARQVDQLFNALTDCVLVFKGRIWTRMLSLLEDVSHNPFCLSEYLTKIFGQLGTHDPALVNQFYHDCLSRGVPVPSEASVVVAQHLALVHSWDQVTAFLQDGRLDNASLEQLLETILSTFRVGRQERTSPMLAIAVGEALLKCFTTTSIPDRLKYPIRFFLPIMVASEHPQKAVQVLETLLRKNPIMFSSRYFLRLVRTLIRHRQPTLAVKVLRLAIDVFKGEPPIIIDLVRKTRQGLIRTRATTLALNYHLAPQRATRSTRDRLVRLTMRKPARWVEQALLQILSASPIKGSHVLIAVQILTRNRRFALARQLINQFHTQLKPQDMTAIGNAYLHGPLLYWNKRNGRLMRHVLRSKDFLVQKHGFVPDRVTINIVIKAMLRWRVHLDSRMILGLFDHLVRNGYPASKRWHTANGVPFGTLPGQMPLDLSGVRQGMSFKRHVRPLYKMFIRELFLRKNSRAAHRIVGILKEEEALAAETKERREQARRLGVAKKQRKLRALARRDGGEKVER
jgi:hypothetical protein